MIISLRLRRPHPNANRIDIIEKRTINKITVNWITPG